MKYKKNKPIYTSDDAEMAEIFLLYFSSVFTEEPQGELPSFEKINFA